jgi:hypothetical protein
MIGNQPQAESTDELGSVQETLFIDTEIKISHNFHVMKY